MTTKLLALRKFRISLIALKGRVFQATVADCVPAEGGRNYLGIIVRGGEVQVVTR